MSASRRNSAFRAERVSLTSFLKTPASILVVTNGPLCRNPRVVKEAAALGTAGHDVTVLAIRSHAPSEPIDLAILEGAPFRRETIDLLPGRGAAAFGRRLGLRLARDAANRLGWKTIHALGPATAVLDQIKTLPADLTIVHNEVPHWAGAQLLGTGRRIAADFEDWHSEDLLPRDRTGRPLALLREVERALLHRASGCTTTSQSLAAALHTRYGGTRPNVVTNSFALQPDPRLAPSGRPPAFFWFSQTLGPGRGLEEFLAAWAHTKQPSRVVLLGESAGGYDQTLLARVPGTRRSLISFRPLVPPAYLPSVIAEHDIGLALEDATIVNRDLTITNKILQYLNAGLAVVASDTAGQREVLAYAPAAGIVVDTHATTAFASSLDALLANRAALAARQAAARQLAEDVYCWENEAPRLLAHVDSALAAPLPRAR